MSTEPTPTASRTASGAGGAPAKQKGSKGGLLAKENRRLVFGLVIGAVVATFAVVNLDDVEVDWIVTTSQTPLIVVIALAFLLGALAGWLASAVGRRRK